MSILTFIQLYTQARSYETVHIQHTEWDCTELLLSVSVYSQSLNNQYKDYMSDKKINNPMDLILYES